jgi:hypothetical protein
MSDNITKLCVRLLKAEHPDELQPAAAQLKQAIRERFDAVREGALEVALLDRLVSGRSLARSPYPHQAEETNPN